MVGLSFVDRLYRGLEVRPGFERDPPEFFQRHHLVPEVERTRHIKLLDRRPIVQQRQQLDLRGSQVRIGSLYVGFILHPLKLQPIQVDAGNITGIESIATDPQQAVVIGKIVSCQSKHGLLLKGLNECIAQIEN